MLLADLYILVVVMLTMGSSAVLCGKRGFCWACPDSLLSGPRWPLQDASTDATSRAVVHRLSRSKSTEKSSKSAATVDLFQAVLKPPPYSNLGAQEGAVLGIATHSSKVSELIEWIQWDRYRLVL